MIASGSWPRSRSSWASAVDRLDEVGVIGARALEQALGAVPVVQPRELGGAAQHPRPRLRLRRDLAEPLERGERLVVGDADLDREPRDRIEDLGVAGGEPVRLAVRVEGAGIVAELAVVDEADLAEQLGALLVVGDVDRAAAEQIDEHRPLAGAAIEQLERLVRVGIVRGDQQHALEAVRRVVGPTDLLPGRRQLRSAGRRRRRR